jgi:GT2 family glycosyltransferase
METAIVIPVGGGRLDNLITCLGSISMLEPRPELVVLVGDGPEGTDVAEKALDATRHHAIDLEIVEAPKHEPGFDQPRNRGVRRVQEINVGIEHPFTHVWFLDSDIILIPDAYDAYLAMENFGTYEGVMAGPYDFMPPGEREPMPRYRQDVRWSAFERRDQEETEGDLSMGLACFGGNLVWPIDEFVRIGGFWNELHHGRCEDGELGLRAVAAGVPIALVEGARGWHLWHGGEPAPKPEWVQWAQGVNAIDVPKLNERHPWVQGAGLFVVEKDGKRFDVSCKCGWSGNTAEIWEHLGYCVVA